MRLWFSIIRHLRHWTTSHRFLDKIYKKLYNKMKNSQYYLQKMSKISVQRHNGLFWFEESASFSLTLIIRCLLQHLEHVVLVYEVELFVWLDHQFFAIGLQFLYDIGIALELNYDEIAAIPLHFDGLTTLQPLPIAFHLGFPGLLLWQKLACQLLLVLYLLIETIYCLLPTRQQWLLRLKLHLQLPLLLPQLQHSLPHHFMSLSSTFNQFGWGRGVACNVWRDVHRYCF